MESLIGEACLQRVQGSASTWQAQEGHHIADYWQALELLCWCLVGAFHMNFLQAHYYMHRKGFSVPLHRYLVRMVPAAGAVL